MNYTNSSQIYIEIDLITVHSNYRFQQLFERVLNLSVFKKKKNHMTVEISINISKLKLEKQKRNKISLTFYNIQFNKSQSRGIKRPANHGHGIGMAIL